MMTIATMEWIAQLLRDWTDEDIDLSMVHSLLADSGLVIDDIEKTNRAVEVREYIGGDVWTVLY